MKSTTLAFLTAACAFTAQAQTGTADIRGKVVDATNNNPVAGATVTLEFNSSIKDTTDAEGMFHLYGEVVGVRANAPSTRGGMVLERGAIRLDVATESRVSVEVFSLDSRRVKTLVDRRLGAGAYSLQNPVAGLPVGVYTVRARLGRQVAAVKVTSMGLSGVSTFGTAAPAFSRLAKTAVDVIDVIHVTKLGYRKIKKEIVKYDGTLSPLDMSPGLPVGDLWLWHGEVEDPPRPHVDYANVAWETMVWDTPQTKLDGGFKDKPFEGSISWKVKFQQTQTHSLWGFATKDDMDPEDMTAWKDGHMHIAIRGTAKDIGISMGSPSNSGNLLMASAYGYKPDTTTWHSLKIPSKDFGIDFSEVTAYLGLSVSEEDFDPETYYVIDDIYWKTTPAPAVVADTTTAQ